MKKHNKTACRLRQLLSVLAIGTTLFICERVGQFCFAQPRKAQSGEISFEADEKKNAFTTSKGTALAYIASASEKLKGGATTISAPSDNDLSYFNAVYLYCTINSGTCPAPLDALYAIDLINAHSSKQPQCPVLTRFWKLWLANGFEDRQRYMIKTAFIGATNTFTNQVRSRYIKCVDTIKEDLASISNDPQIVKERIGPEGTYTNAVVKFDQLMKAINDKGIDVFGAIGITGKAATDTTPEKK